MRAKTSSLAVYAGLALIVLGACRAAPVPREQILSESRGQLRALAASLEAPTERAPGSLVVWLAFGSEADLDVFVTAPDQETVYFANTPTRLGGSLDRDVRCDQETSSVFERVVFPKAQPGTYRVGIDFPRRCDDGDGAVTYVVRVEHDGGSRQVTGVVRPGEFLTRVLEETVGAESDR